MFPAAPISRYRISPTSNFIKKSMWELSGQSEYEYTIWGFDGRIFRGHVAVFGAPKAFNYMADAMATFQTRGSNRYECRAVFVHEEASRDLYLIYAEIGRASCRERV